MREAARALNAEEVIELIHSHIAAFLNDGRNRKSEDIELGRNAGLELGMIATLWDDAEKQVLRQPEIGKGVTALPAAKAPKVADVDSANGGWGKRRSLGEETPQAEGKNEALFISPAIQPVVEDAETTLEP